MHGLFLQLRSLHLNGSIRSFRCVNHKQDLHSSFTGKLNSCQGEGRGWYNPPPYTFWRHLYGIKSARMGVSEKACRANILFTFFHYKSNNSVWRKQVNIFLLGDYGFGTRTHRQVCYLLHRGELLHKREENSKKNVLYRLVRQQSWRCIPTVSEKDSPW